MNALETVSTIRAAALESSEAGRRLAAWIETIYRQLKQKRARASRVTRSLRIVRAAPVKDFPMPQQRQLPPPHWAETVNLMQEELARLWRRLEQADQERAKLRHMLSDTLALAGSLANQGIRPERSVASEHTETSPPLGHRQPMEPPAASIDPIDALLQGRPDRDRPPQQRGGDQTPQPLADLSALAAKLQSRRADPPTAAAEWMQPLPPEEPDTRKADLNAAISRYLDQGWQLSTKLDVRAELQSPDGKTKLYLEAQHDGTVLEQAC